MNRESEDIFVGVDLHKYRWHVTTGDADDELFSGWISGGWEALRRLLGRYEGNRNWVVYEAGYFGFWLRDRLVSKQRVKAEMIMGIDETRKHSSSVQVDNLRFRCGQFLNLGCLTNLVYAAELNGQGLCPGNIFLHGQNIPVLENLFHWNPLIRWNINGWPLIPQYDQLSQSYFEKEPQSYRARRSAGKAVSRSCEGTMDCNLLRICVFTIH